MNEDDRKEGPTQDVSSQGLGHNADPSSAGSASARLARARELDELFGLSDEDLQQALRQEVSRELSDLARLRTSLIGLNAAIERWTGVLKELEGQEKFGLDALRKLMQFAHERNQEFNQSPFLHPPEAPKGR